MSEHSNKIRDLNDRFRRGDPKIPGRRLITRNLINMMTEENIEMADVCPHIMGYDDFTSANDPHGEHDFGQFYLNCHKCFWKIDGVDAPSHGGIELCQTGFVRNQFN